MAEDITIQMRHKTTRAEARQRIESGFHKVQEQIAGKGVAVDQSWTGDEMTFTAKAMGMSFDGSLEVDDEHVHIHVTLPWMLAKLAGPIQEKLKSGTQLLLDKK